MGKPGMKLRPALLAGLAAALAAPAFADTQVWECRIERRIDSGHTTMMEDGQRASPKMRFDFVIDSAANKACLLKAGSPDICDVIYTGAGEAGGMVHMAVKADDMPLDLVNIFPRTGTFIRIFGDTQWMGKQGDCVPARGRVVKLP